MTIPAASVKRPAREDADAAVDESTAKLPGLGRRADELEPQTRRLTAARPSLNTLLDLTSQWQALNAQLTDAQQTLTREASRRERDLRRLQDLLRLWEATATEARAANAPAPLRARCVGRRGHHDSISPA